MRLDLLSPQQRVDLAEDYVLGLLDDGARQALETALEEDRALQDLVARAQARFLPLDLAAAPLPLDGGLWDRIAARLADGAGDDGARPPPVAAVSGGGVAAGAAAPPAGRSVPAPAANDNGLARRRLRRWQGASLAGLAASLLLAVGLGFSLTRTVEPVAIAVLLNEGGEIRAVVEDFGTARARIHLLADLTVPEGKALQVWTLPSKDRGPVSLGLLEGASSALLVGPPLGQPRDEQLYEITLEQEGGSPTGRPTGPILAKGFARLPR